MRCTATDIAGNAAQTSFSVTVRDTAPPAVVVPADIAVDATGPAGAVVTYAATSRAISDLHAFENHVKAQSGNSIPAATADTLISAAERIIHVL